MAKKNEDGPTYVEDDDQPKQEPMDILARLVGALERMQAPDASANAAVLDKLTEAIDRISGQQAAGAKLAAEAIKKGQRPSNEVPPMISDFNPRGDKDFPKPPLKCEFFIPYPAEFDALTREEIELLNLVEPGEYPIRRNDGTRIKMIVTGIKNLDGMNYSRILINHDTANNNDNHMLMPPVADWLRQIVRQIPGAAPRMKGILTMDEEILLIQRGKLNDGSDAPVVVSVGE